MKFILEIGTQIGDTHTTLFLKIILFVRTSKFLLILQADCNKTITLVEGGPEEKVTFTFQRNPEELCAGHADCHVFVDVVVETGEQPQ